MIRIRETEEQRAFRRMVLNSLAGRCVCGRRVNKHGKVCCRMCHGGYGTHSVLCRRNNPSTP